MELNKLKQPLWDLIRNFLIDDYSSWQRLDLSNFKRQKSRNYEKKKENSQIKKGRSMALETHARAWIKSIVWRLLGIVILGTISWIITKSWKEMSMITLLFHSIRVILYYFHERVWERISWGRVKHPLSIFPVKKELRPEDMKLIQGQLKELGYLD
jgi:uncharacterized membrane protein